MADSNGEILKSLRDRRRSVEAHRDELKTFWEQLNAVIEDYERTGQFDKLIEDTKEKLKDNAKMPGLTEFIRQLFNSQPEKKWRHASLMSEAGSAPVKTGGKLNNNLYSVLQRLIGQGEVEPGGNPRNRWYRKKKTAVMTVI